MSKRGAKRGAAQAEAEAAENEVPAVADKGNKKADNPKKKSKNQPPAPPPEFAPPPPSPPPPADAAKRKRKDADEGGEAPVAVVDASLETGGKRKSTRTATENVDDIELSNVWKLTEETKKLLTEKGISWNTGKWLQSERDRLDANIKEYLDANNMKETDLANLINTPRKDRKEASSLEGMYRSLASGIQRPIVAIYRFLARKYEQAQNKGPWKPEESQKLRALMEAHGRDWKKIGTLLNRTATSVKDHARWVLPKARDKGPWSNEETDRLEAIIKEVLQSTGKDPTKTEDLEDHFPWKIVSDKLGSRTGLQCRDRWMRTLSKRTVARMRFTDEHAMELIGLMEATDAQVESDIDWSKIAKKFTGVPINGDRIRRRWGTIKLKIPDASTMPLHDLIKAARALYTTGKSRDVLVPADADD